MKAKCFKNEKSIKEMSEISNFLKTISEENRLKIICLLGKGEKCVCEIWQHLKLSQNLTSHHLSKLEKLALVEKRREGTFIIYSINEKNLEKYKKILNKII